jgi:hypothetical protein
MTVQGSETSLVMGSLRGVAEDYLVLPAGAELTGQLKMITSGPSLDGQPLTLGDLALFELAGRYAPVRRIDISGSVDFLPKQPAYSDEKVWQSASAGVRAALAPNVALGISSSVGHLLDHQGAWLRDAAMLEWKHTLNEFVAFDVQGGGDVIELGEQGAPGAHLVEAVVQASSFFREPTGHWGAWLGTSYSVPVEHAGTDPTTGMTIDPKPCLGLHVGTVWAVTPEWDLFVDGAVIARGNMAVPSTTLPILDGGFDQRQLVLGVTRHFTRDASHDRRSVAEPMEL